jgi:hypothetical protein
MSPTARTLAALRQRGCLAAVVERWLPHARVRQDVFGFCDIVYVDRERTGTVYVQATSGTNHAARRRKLLALPALGRVLAAGNPIEVWSWSKRGKRGMRKCWRARVEPLTLGDLPHPEGEDAA